MQFVDMTKRSPRTCSRSYPLTPFAKIEVVARLRTEVGVEEIPADRPDAVVVAAGSSPYCPEVIGKDKRHMLTAREVIQDNAETGENMLVVATLGCAEAPTVAEFIADMGRKVEVVTGLAYGGTALNPSPGSPEGCVGFSFVNRSGGRALAAIVQAPVLDRAGWFSGRSPRAPSRLPGSRRRRGGLRDR